MYLRQIYITEHKHGKNGTSFVFLTYIFQKLFVAFTSTKNIFLYNSKRELYSFVEFNVFIFTTLSIRWRENSIRKEILYLQKALYVPGKILVNLYLQCSRKHEQKKSILHVRNVEHRKQNMSFYRFNDFVPESSTPFVRIKYALFMCCFSCNEIMLNILEASPFGCKVSGIDIHHQNFH